MSTFFEGGRNEDIAGLINGFFVVPLLFDVGEVSNAAFVKLEMKENLSY